jgi:hypothetical protein
MSHFASVVPARAAHCRLLLYAILAHASQHRNRLLGESDSLSRSYQDRCLRILIRFLNNAQFVPDEDFLAALVILRSWEEMSGEMQDPTQRTQG